MKYLISLFVVLSLLFGPISGIAYAVERTADVGYSGYPTFSISSVEKDSTVTIKTYNLPPQDTFRVRMGLMGTRGVNGIKVSTFDSGKGGVQTLTFKIPHDLYGKKQIAIRIESTNRSGYYAYNWFYNNTTGTSGNGGKGGKPGYTGHPTITILSVVRNQSVTFRANNLPPSDEFKVLMNNMGTRGVNGVNVGSFKTGDGGKKIYTFSIPEKFQGRKQIAIRIQSTTGSGYYAYNWFHNNTTK
jgi:hypothetical protein